MVKNFQRIMIFGRPGSGKSTFAVNVAENLDLPVYHIDQYFFTDHWQERDKQDFLSILQSQVAQDRWIIDGNAISYLPVRYERCDLAIYFNFSMIACLWGILKRLFHRDTRIQDRADNCNERITFGLIRYMWQFDGRIQPILRDLKQKHPDVVLVVIKNRKELQSLCDKIIEAKKPFDG